VSKILLYNHKFSIAAVGIFARPFCVDTEVLGTSEAEIASPTGGIEPCNTDAVTELKFIDGLSLFSDSADYLVAGHDWQLGRLESAFDLVKVRMAGSADRNFDENFVITGDRAGDVGKLQGFFLDR
jgi:hypothetical protein